MHRYIWPFKAADKDIKRKILYSLFHINTRLNIPYPLQKRAGDFLNYCISKRAFVILHLRLVDFW